MASCVKWEYKYAVCDIDHVSFNALPTTAMFFELTQASLYGLWKKVAAN